jgi:hypothetical protein
MDDLKLVAGVIEKASQPVKIEARTMARYRVDMNIVDDRVSEYTELFRLF